MAQKNDFNTGLFSCFEDKTLCLLSFVAPNYIFGRLAEMVLMQSEDYYTGVLKYSNNDMPRIVDSLLWMAMFSGPTLCFIRQKVRKMLNHPMEENEIMDCVFSCLCPCCVTYQMTKEMNFSPLARR